VLRTDYDRAVSRLVPFAACALLACASAARPPELPFDARPTMRAVLADTRRIAQVLEDGALADALPSARRLATLRIARARDGIDPRFLAAEASLRAGAAPLVDALRAGDRAAAARDFDALLLRCDACHATFRPGGVAGLPERP
jgi:cytochrome c556